MPAPDTAQLAAWKAKYGDVYAIEVGGLTGYVRLPARADVMRAVKEGKAEPIECAAQLLLTCWLGGDDQLRQEDEYLLPATIQFGELLPQPLKASLKKA